jgi:hypothetical protein
VVEGIRRRIRRLAPLDPGAAGVDGREGHVVLVPVGSMALVLGFAGTVATGEADSDRLFFLGLGFAGAAALTTGIILIVAGRTKVTLESPGRAAALSLPLGRGVTLSPAGLAF